MAWKLPRLLRRIHPRLGHYQHSLPLRPDGRTVLTVHDLSFEREPSLMPRRDRLVFKTVVPRSARRADRLIAVSDRTKDDLVELYDIPERKIAVIPHGVDPAFTPAPDGGEGYLLFVGAVQRRKDPRAALEAAQELRMPLVVVGPEKEAALARELRRLGPENVAAFFCEPVIGAGGVRLPPEGYLEGAARVCGEHGVLFIADEVICGFGRLGAWFGVQRW